MTKIRFRPSPLAFLLLVVGSAVAQLPKENVSPGRHPNLAAAQRLSRQAYEKIVAAQQANEWDLAGHAQKAKDLLESSEQRIETGGAGGEPPQVVGDGSPSGNHAIFKAGRRLCQSVACS